MKITIDKTKLDNVLKRADLSQNRLELSREIWREIDIVRRTHAGKPFADVLAALKSVLNRAGVTPRGMELDKIARSISGGSERK